MVINYLFTGLLAALLSVPGTGQKEVATVGEEPAKAELKTVQEEEMYWYPTNPAGTHTDGSTPILATRTEMLSQGCDGNSGVVCLFGSDDPDLPANTEVGTPSTD